MKNRVIREMLDLATYRNVVIFDEIALPGQLTPRLIDVINDNLHQVISGIITSEDVQVPNEILLKYRDLAIFKIDKEEYQECRRYYLNTLHGSFASGDKEFGIAMTSYLGFVLFSF
jgi:hypothetical protein